MLCYFHNSCIPLGVVMIKSVLSPRTLFSAVCFTFLFICFGSSAFGQKVRLRAQITPPCPEVRSAAGPGIKFSDIYGDGNIAVQGSYNCNGAFIYDITNPDAPVLASWYNPGNNQQFLEAIVIGNRGYFGSGIGNGGVHIVDLSNPYNPVMLGTVDATHGNGHPIIHEMLVLDQGGKRYLIENYNSTLTKPLRVIDITDPRLLTAPPDSVGVQEPFYRRSWFIPYLATVVLTLFFLYAAFRMVRFWSVCVLGAH